MLLTITLDAEEDLIGLCVEFSSIVGIGCMQAVTMGCSLMQGTVHVDETGG